jgi:hypothetical protein
MFKKLLKSLVRKVVKNDIAAELIAEKADRAIVKELDRKTGGLASKADEVI